MQDIIKSGFKFWISAGFFDTCIHLIYLALPLFMWVVYDRVLFSASPATLYTLGAGLLICLVVAAGIEYCRRRIMIRAAGRLVEKMRPFVLNSLVQYPRGLDDLECVRTALAQGYVLGFLAFPWVVIYLVVIYLIHPLIGAVCAGAVFLAWVTLMLLRILAKKRYIAADMAFRDNVGRAEKILSHADLVTAMGLYGAVTAQYRDRDDKVMALAQSAEAFHGAVAAALAMVFTAVCAVIFGAGVMAFFADELTVGAIFALVTVFMGLTAPLERALLTLKPSIEARAAWDRLNAFVNRDIPKERVSLPAPEGTLAVQGAGLALNRKMVLHNISFDLAPGQSLGIIGPSSAGKTSLCKMLTGIQPATGGKISLDGAELAQWPPETLSGYMGYLPQETDLFPGSVAQNIARLGPVDSKKVVNAAQQAGVHEMILRLAQGYDTQIDGTCKNLSAGQRQLISLARAFYGDPKLVVLDEPHTHLDDSGFRILAHGLGNLKTAGATAVVVTDRPNLLVNMDKLLVIKEGQVAMYGPAKDVLNQLANNQKPQPAAGV